MSLPTPTEVSVRLAELLAGDDARSSLEAGLAWLARLGVDADTRELAPLLELARLRAAEQDAHKNTRERLDLLSEASFEGILVHVDGVVIDVNKRLAEMLRCQPEELLGPDTIARTTAAEDIPAQRERVRSGYEGCYTVTAIRADGTRFRAELQSKHGRLGDRPVRIAAVRDVTERERTLSLLQESEKHLRDLALGGFDFMVVVQNGVLVDAGGNVEGAIGYTREEIIGRSALDLAAPEAHGQVAEAIDENRPGAYQTIMLSKTGEHIPVEVMGVRSTLNGQPARVSGFRDLRERQRVERERRKLELQVERTQRLDSLGVLAGGIAHDFNNLLVGMVGNASLLLTTLTEKLDREAAEAILAAGERAASLTRQMLAYAGRQDLNRREPVDLHDVFRELRTLLDATLSKKASLQLEIEAGSVVLGDRAPLTQVMMNLLTNASDALMGNPGRIQVRARRVAALPALWDDALGQRGAKGPFLVVDIEDDGVGMDEATRLRVFEPFFTTKEHGHGLGLAACVGIVTSHGGALRLESEPGRGSCFSLALPTTDEPRSPPPQLASSGANQPCRVLVIDDEQLVRMQLRRSLERSGYQVEEAPNGVSGVAANAAQPADVLIVDLTMPDIDGVEVVRRVRAAGSTAAIVLSSGYQAHATAERLEPGSFQAFLPKPFTMKELLHAIEQARARARA
ncbi:MAG TPA: response regulator [Polyangiaceae bacterium]|nr:response regulator [Polyangiaceae bacterium]